MFACANINVIVLLLAPAASHNFNDNLTDVAIR